MSRLQREWQAFWLALGFLSRIPVPVRIDYSPALMNAASLYFPLVGLLLGGLYTGLYLALIPWWPQMVAILVVLAFHLWITGAFHEDGWADSVDALGGGFSREARLRIMKDSRIGTYGTLALVLAIGLKAALIAAVEPVWLALLLPPVIARLTPLWLMAALPWVSDPEASRTRPVAEGLSTPRLMLATLLTLVPVVLFGWPVLAAAVVAVALVALLWGRLLRRSLGGYTGDGLGASVVLAELVLLMGLAL